MCIVSEQRVTGILVYVMVGLSALLADLLKVMPSFCVFCAYAIYWYCVLDTCIHYCYRCSTITITVNVTYTSYLTFRASSCYTAKCWDQICLA